MPGGVSLQLWRLTYSFHVMCDNMVNKLVTFLMHKAEGH